jgi:hypothetical protein
MSPSRAIVMTDMEECQAKLTQDKRALPGKKAKILQFCLQWDWSFFACIDYGDSIYYRYYYKTFFS